VPEARLELFDGHLVVDTGARLLVDTGSPVSFASSGRIDWAEQAHEVSTTALGLDAAELSRLVGTQMEGLVGGDLLGLHAFTIDIERGVFGFEEPAPDLQIAELPIGLVLGVPLATVELDGVPTKACIDTGAKLSYLDEVHLSGRKAVDETDDFYPGLGTFRTPVYETRARISDVTFTMRAGVLPDTLSGMLGMLGVAAIVGTELFTRFPFVQYDYPAARMVLLQPSP